MTVAQSFILSPICVKSYQRRDDSSRHTHQKLGANMQQSAAIALLMTSALAAGQTTVTIAGTGTAGFSGDGGPGTQAETNTPYGLTTGPDGALYFCESGNPRAGRLDLHTNPVTP